MSENFLLNHQLFDYTRIKALTWIANQGLSPKLLQHDAARVLAQILKKEKRRKPLVVNLQGLTEISEYSLSELRDSVGTNTLVFLNGDQLQSRLNAEMESPSVYHRDCDFRVYGNETIELAMAKRIVSESRALEQSHLVGLIRESFRSFGGETRLHSTPLLANGVYDARSIISDPQQFVWLILLMAERLEVLLEEFEQSGTTNIPSSLLAVSLRASPIASALRLVSVREFDVEVVDHMGPVHAIIEEHSLAERVRGVSYIYIGDFLIGGTELKTAQMYSAMNGCKLGAAMVIGHWLPLPDYERNMQIRIDALIDLKNCRDDVNVRFAG